MSIHMESLRLIAKMQINREPVSENDLYVAFNALPKLLAVVDEGKKMRESIKLETDAYGLHIANLEGDVLIRACEVWDKLMAEL